MENIAFILWMCLWPITCTIDSYWSAKKRLITGEEMPSKITQAFMVLIQVIIWVAVAKSL